MQSHLVFFEIGKLALQLAGALLVARFAVKWALSRYKSEKTWERRLSAYADAVTAISEMQLVVGRWYDEVIEHRQVTAEYERVQRERYQAARRRLDEGVAAGLLLLPAQTAELLSGLARNLDTHRPDTSQEEDLDEQYGLLKAALEQLISQGRDTLAIR